MTMDKFWSNIEKTGSCWLWTAAITHEGYGSLTINNLKIYAHRFSYELHCGIIPGDLTVDHVCRVRRCVNPDHLRLLSARDNVLAGMGITAMNARKTHCNKNHELSGDNLYIPPGRPNERHCRICKRLHDRKRKDRLIAERATQRAAALLAAANKAEEYIPPPVCLTSHDQH
jgi:HNH endonuclease